MIARLAGELVEKVSGHVVIDVGGVGYLVHVGANTYYALPEPPARVQLLIFTAVREDDISLYGFPTELERRLFVLLLTVPKVGPRAAMGMMSAYDAATLLGAVAGGDVRLLSKVPGIGKKTAERVIVDLADKAAKLLEEINLAPPAPLGRASAADADAVSALQNLGYKLESAEDAVAAARRETGEDADLQTVIRAALKRLAKG